MRPQKIKAAVAEEFSTKENVRLMFQDEAGFGRINKPKYCRCEKGVRPSVPCHHVREYRYAYGAVEPLTGESSFLVLPYCNSACMNIFLKHVPRGIGKQSEPGLRRYGISKEDVVVFPTTSSFYASERDVLVLMGQERLENT